MYMAAALVHVGYQKQGSKFVRQVHNHGGQRMATTWRDLNIWKLIYFEEYLEKLCKNTKKSEWFLQVHLYPSVIPGNTEEELSNSLQ